MSKSENDPLISVIVPVYNVEKYLPKCIESIINQTYKNLEIILVDDGATDNSGKICDEFAKKDKRIKVIHKKNGGLSDARHFGLDVSGGAGERTPRTCPYQRKAAPEFHPYPSGR